MFGNKKQSERELELEAAIKELQKHVDVLKSQNSHLLISSKRWAKKFSNPLYQVPEKVIEQMKKDFAVSNKRTRAKLDELAVKNKILMDRIIKLTQEKTADAFGSATGDPQITFAEATSHVFAQPLEKDYKEVELELDGRWAAQMNALAEKNKH